MKKIIITFSISLLVISCKKDIPAENKIVEKAAGNTESSFPIKRMGKSQDILDGMYSELIKNDLKLQALNEKVISTRKDSKIIEDLNVDILKNTTDYYDQAENSAKSIQDSVLKKEIMELVNNSSDNYYVKKDKFEELKRQLKINNEKIYSFYQAVKIRKTLPEIEKYQKANPLKTDSLINFINKQNQLLNELKNLK